MFEPGKLKDLVSKPDVHEPFSLGSLIAWLRTKPGDEAYDYWDCEGGCLLSQYASDHGMVGRRYCVVFSAFYDLGFDAQPLARAKPRTFGAALSRALAAQASV